MQALQSPISSTVSSTPAGPARNAALRAIRWRLHCPALGVYAGLDESGGIVALPSVTGAQVFDGRDNEAAKLAFYRRATGIAWEVEVAR